MSILLHDVAPRRRRIKELQRRCTLFLYFGWIGKRCPPAPLPHIRFFCQLVCEPFPFLLCHLTVKLACCCECVLWARETESTVFWGLSHRGPRSEAGNWTREEFILKSFQPTNEELQTDPFSFLKCIFTFFDPKWVKIHLILIMLCYFRIKAWIIRRFFLLSVLSSFPPDKLTKKEEFLYFLKRFYVVSF